LKHPSSLCHCWSSQNLLRGSGKYIGQQAEHNETSARLGAGHYGFMEESRAFQSPLTADIACRFELVATSSFGSHATDVKENSPRRARRTRRMEFKKLSNRVKRVKTGLSMDFNGTHLGGCSKRDRLLHSPGALRVLRGEGVLCLASVLCFALWLPTQNDEEPL